MNTKTAAKVSAAAISARPYVQRAISDEELRSSVKTALDAARSVYGELVGDRDVTRLATRVASDQDIHESLRTTITELRRAADRLQGKEEKEARSHRFLLFTGIVLAALFNPVTGAATRHWLADRLFGADDSTYTSAGGNGVVGG
jgi:hypothetical protein